MVGAAGFELTTLCSQSRCATRLRYAPTSCVFYRLYDVISGSAKVIECIRTHRPCPGWTQATTFLPSTRLGDRTPMPQVCWRPARHLDVPTLCRAYAEGIFPWFSDGPAHPVVEPRPAHGAGRRQVPAAPLAAQDAAETSSSTPGCEIRIDSRFRPGDPGLRRQRRATARPAPGSCRPWCRPTRALHRAGFAHSVETWIDGELAGGLYCVALGQAVFGESMFARVHRRLQDRAGGPGGLLPRTTASP